MVNYIKDLMPPAMEGIVLLFDDGSMHSGLYTYINYARNDLGKKLYYECLIKGEWCVSPYQVGATYDGEPYFLNDPIAWVYEKDAIKLPQSKVGVE